MSYPRLFCQPQESCIAGQDILKMRDNQLSDFRRNEMGFIFQSFNLIDTLNVKDNILLPLAVEKVSLEEMDKRLLHVTSILGIQELLSAYPPEISVGQNNSSCSCFDYEP